MQQGSHGLKGVRIVSGFGLDAVGHENAIGVARIVPGHRRAISNSTGSGHESAIGVARIEGFVSWLVLGLLL